MIWSILRWAAWIVGAYLGTCFLIGCICALVEELGIQRKVKPTALGPRRKPKFRVVRYEEETE
jgi:hypothetical protein